MKNLRKMIPAVAMLVLSAVLLSTASFAWFSMSTEVTADGMTVTAQSDSVTLIIKSGANQTIGDADTATTASASLNAKLYPVAPAVTLTAANIGTKSSWHYAYSNSTTVAKPDNITYTVVPESANLIATTDLAGYIAKQSFTIGLQNSTYGAESIENLRVKSLTIPANTGITVVLVCGSNIFTYNATVSAETNDILDDEIKKGTPVNVDVYIYVNGDDSNVTTTNISALTGGVEIVFTAGAAEEATSGT